VTLNLTSNGRLCWTHALLDASRCRWTRTLVKASAVGQVPRAWREAAAFC
jgi:hypothetical protein